MSALARSGVAVEVPASSANLGVGFDALALALELHLRVTAEVAGDGEGTLEVRGEGAVELEQARFNAYLAGVDAGFRDCGQPAPPALRVVMDNEIPLSRGLGSSASAFVAGLATAQGLAAGALDRERLLALAVAQEGHGDNAAAVLHGGFVVVAADSVVRYEPPAQLRAVLFIPGRELATDEMRAVLPPSVPHSDAVHNMGRAALLVSAFATGDVSLLSAMNDDRLHEPYRAEVFRELPALKQAAREAGALGAALSGAGSSVIALCEGEESSAAVARAMSQRAAQLGLRGDSRVLKPASSGARMVDRPSAGSV